MKRLRRRRERPMPARRETLIPARSSEFGADVGVPAAQALITGGLVAGFVVFLIWQLAPRFTPLLETWIGLALFIAAAFWIALLLQTRRLLWTIERWLDEDLDGDKWVGKPSRGRRELSVDVRNGGRHRLVDSDWLGMDDDNLIRFTRGLAQRQDLTEGRWARDPAFPQGINEFRRVRTKLLEAKLIEQIYPGRANSPYRLTPAGRAFVRRVADAGVVYPTPASRIVRQE